MIERLPDLHPVLKVIIITAYGDMENIRAAMHRGAYDFLTKPLNLSDLEYTITRALTHVQQYVRQVNRLIEAAAAIEAGNLDPSLLSEVCQCPGALGRLGRVFHTMVLEMYSREQQLRQQVQDLQIDLAISDMSLILLRPDQQGYQGTGVSVDVARRLQVRA